MDFEKTIVWRRLNFAGHEFARVFSANENHFLEGAIVFVFEGKNCRIDYLVKCDKNWHTLFANIYGFVGDKKIESEIKVDAEKRWNMDGQEIASVEDCIDIDLNLSPSTNLLPIRRLNLQIGEKAKVRAAWLKFPSFMLEPLEQTYHRTGENSYLYKSGSFRAEIETDDFGIPVKYPGFGEIEK